MSATAPAPSPSARWLFGPVPDLLLGCGGLYFALFAVLSVAGPALRETVPLALLPLGLLLLGTPHYGATLLRVAERGEDRRTYGPFTAVVSLGLAVAFAAGVHSAWVGSWLFTIYMTWSPWHYSGQNYGLALMFLGRRGIPLAPGTKRLFHASFLLSFVLTVIATQSSTASFAPVDAGGAEITLLRAGIPVGPANVALVVLSVAYLGCLAAVAAALLRRAGPRALLPTALITAMQALWFVVPLLVGRWGGLPGVDSVSGRHGYYAFLWIAIAHSVQYLWVTGYYATRDGGPRGGAAGQARHLGKALLAGSALWALPALLFAPGALGRLPYDAGLGLLVASAVNLHHFLLDGAIWKLRDGRIARVLLRRQDAGPPEAVEPEPSRAPVLVWSVAALALVVLAWGRVEEARLAWLGDRVEAHRLEAALDRLAWIGQDSARLRAHGARLHLAAGDTGRALVAAQAAVGLAPGAESWIVLGRVHEEARRPAAAVEAYREALAAAPESRAAAGALARVLARSRDPERIAEAVRLVEPLLASGVREPLPHLDTLAVALARLGRIDEAIEVRREMLRVAPGFEPARRALDELLARRGNV